MRSQCLKVDPAQPQWDAITFVKWEILQHGQMSYEKILKYWDETMIVVREPVPEQEDPISGDQEEEHRMARRSTLKWDPFRLGRPLTGFDQFEKEFRNCKKIIFIDENRPNL